MSFPSLPSNGQQATVNNIKYSYSTATFAWTRVAAPGIGADGTTAFPGTFVIINPSQSTSPTSGALQVTGGAGIGGNVYVGGLVSATSLTVNGQPVYPTNIQSFVAAANTTTFTVAGGYNSSATMQVFVNGLLLDNTDYTATDGAKIVLAVARNLNDRVTVISHQLATTAPQSLNSVAIALSIAMGI
jgi:hypothetical protein